MKIYVADLTKLAFDFKGLLSSLDKEKQEQILSYKNKGDQVRSLVAAVMVEKFTPKSKLFLNEFGKPYKNCGYFNVAHSGDLVVLATSENHEVGIDVEDKNRDKKGVDKYAFNEEMDNETFIENWTRKEAISKCVGTGLGKDFKDIPHQEGFVDYKDKHMFVQSLRHGDYVISVAKETNRSEEPEIVEVESL